MKTIINRIFLLLCMAAFVVSCDKDGDLVYVDGFGSSDLIASTDNVELSVDNSKRIVLSLAWKNPTLLSSDERSPVSNSQLTTAMQVSSTADFAKYTETTVTNLSRAYTGTELNSLAVNLGLATGTSAPLYFRIKSSEGDNMEPAYSNVCQVNVTPFKIDKTYLSVYNSGKTDVVAYLYSPSENGVYTGWMVATSWYNCWFMENDGTYWGNSPVDGHPFELSNASDAWNCWFADGTGQWYVTVDTNNEEWSAMLITSMMVNGESMRFDSSTGSYKYTITTVSDNETIVLTADALAYDKDTDTDASAAVAKKLNYAVTDGILAESGTAASVAIAKAGTYTVTVSISDKAEQVLSITEGAGDTPDPQVTLVDKDGNTLAVFTEVSSGVYEATCEATQWMNFYIVDKDGTWWGCPGEDGHQFELASENKWNCWLNDDFENGATVKITADFNTLTWSYKAVKTLAMVNPDNTETLATLVESSDGIYEGTLSASPWLNFKIYDSATGTLYGSDPSNQYALSSDEGAWNIWLNDDFSDGASVTVTVNYSALTWSYTVN